jgi:hypothetical protein
MFLMLDYIVQFCRILFLFSCKVGQGLLDIDCHEIISVNVTGCFAIPFKRKFDGGSSDGRLFNSAKFRSHVWCN